MNVDRTDAVSAYRRLLRIENTPEDAKGNFQMVESQVKAGRTTWEEGTSTFETLMRAEGGARMTAETRDAFRAVARAADPARAGVSFSDLTESYVELRQRENESAQARGNFELVVSVAERTGRSVADVANVFNALLHLEGGARMTDEARASFNRIVREVQPERGFWSLEGLTSVYSELRTAENAHDQAHQNFNLVLAAARKTQSAPLELARTFNQLLRDHGGARMTNEAQAAFRTIYDV